MTRDDARESSGHSARATDEAARRTRRARARCDGTWAFVCSMDDAPVHVPTPGPVVGRPHHHADHACAMHRAAPPLLAASAPTSGGIVAAWTAMVEARRVCAGGLEVEALICSMHQFMCPPRAQLSLDAPVHVPTPRAHDDLEDEAHLRSERAESTSARKRPRIASVGADRCVGERRWRRSLTAGSSNPVQLRLRFGIYVSLRQKPGGACWLR